MGTYGGQAFDPLNWYQTPTDSRVIRLSYADESHNKRRPGGQTDVKNQ